MILSKGAITGIVVGVASYFLLRSFTNLSHSITLYTSLLLWYLPIWTDGAQYRVTPAEGSRYWPWFAQLSIWNRIMAYFPSSIILPPATAKGESSPFNYNGAQYIFSMHPHGVLSIDHFLLFTDAVGFLTKVHTNPRRDLAASVIFLFPFFRDFVLWLGCVDAGAATAHKSLSLGYSLQVYPGGIAEQLATNSGKPTIVAEGRMGFIKLALAYDVPIVPCYIFGEDKLYTSLSYFSSFRQMLLRKFRVGWPLYYGRLDTLGVLPHREPLEMICGEPLWPKGVSVEKQKEFAKMRQDASALPKQAKTAKSSASSSTPVDVSAGSFLPGSGRRVKRDVSQEEIEELHTRYVVSLKQIFETHKHNHPKYANATLEVLKAK